MRPMSLVATLAAPLRHQALINSNFLENLHVATS